MNTIEKLKMKNQDKMGLQEISTIELQNINGGISIWGVVGKYYAISAISPAYGFAYGLGVLVGVATAD